MKMSKNTYFRDFKGSVTLTLTFDDLEKYIVVLGSSTSIYSTIGQMPLLSFIVNGRKDVRTDGQTF